MAHTEAGRWVRSCPEAAVREEERIHQCYVAAAGMSRVGTEAGAGLANQQEVRHFRRSRLEADKESPVEAAEWCMIC